MVQYLTSDVASLQSGVERLFGIPPPGAAMTETLPTENGASFLGRPTLPDCPRAQRWWEVDVPHRGMCVVLGPVAHSLPCPELNILKAGSCVDAGDMAKSCQRLILSSGQCAVCSSRFFLDQKDLRVHGELRGVHGGRLWALRRVLLTERHRRAVLLVRRPGALHHQDRQRLRVVRGRPCCDRPGV